ncbi:E3 ubiquitin-protein ligase rnf213-alpha-like [Amphiura filiformis]|uniref:E3 ubiquitin-protein ligase rnf213-alpha-like n=1 Tax=Amphiura filiformis TaxID=82378 RepID=UPI003B216D73
MYRCQRSQNLGPGDIARDDTVHDHSAGEVANGDQNDDKDVYQLMLCFLSAWNQVWPKSKRHVTLVEAYQQPLNIDYCNLATFLPTASGISTQLVDFLIRTHNEFVDTYCRIRNQENEENILPSSVTLTHLVAYDLDKDLLPLIQAHCHHIFDEEVTSATFNLDSLERAIEETFIRGRPRIEGTLPKLMFREGSRSLRVFQEIRAKVKQERLSRPFKQDILLDLKSITDLCDCLAVVDIAIGFLVSTGGEPDTNIIEYLAESGINLPKEQRSQITAKARHRSLKHILDLWQLLGVERAKRRLASEKQDPFEGIPEQFQDIITQEERHDLSRSLRYVDIEELISQLFEYIEINLKTSNPDVESFDPESLLFEELMRYMKQKQHHNRGLRAMENMKKRNAGLTLGKAVETWILAVKYQAGIEQKSA